MPGTCVSDLHLKDAGHSPVAPSRCARAPARQCCLFGKLDGIAEHINEHLTQLVDIGHDVLGTLPTIATENDNFSHLCGRAEHHSVFEQHGQVERGKLRVSPPASDLGITSRIMLIRAREMFAAARLMGSPGTGIVAA